MDFLAFCCGDNIYAGAHAPPLPGAEIHFSKRRCLRRCPFVRSPESCLCGDNVFLGFWGARSALSFLVDSSRYGGGASRERVENSPL